MFDYDPSTMSPNPDGCEEELPFQEGDTIKVVKRQKYSPSVCVCCLAYSCCLRNISFLFYCNFNCSLSNCLECSHTEHKFELLLLYITLKIFNQTLDIFSMTV